MPSGGRPTIVSFVSPEIRFGGVTGTFSLFYHDWPVGIEGPPAFDPAAVILQVYPNPGREVFNLKLDNAGSPEIEILVYSLSGKLVRRKSFSNVPGELFTRLDLGDQPAGIYHLRVIDGDRILDRKLVKQ